MASTGRVLNFAGFAKMQATVSEMVGGWKGLLLKPVDRYFKRKMDGDQGSDSYRRHAPERSTLRGRFSAA